MEKLYVIDGHSLAYRAYWAFVSAPLINSKGMNTGATFGFLRMIMRILKAEKPDYVTVAFDSPKPTFRHKAFPDYKSTRAKMPEDLRPQIPIMKEILLAYGIPILELEGYEADDILATIAEKMRNKPVEVILVSSDKDILQVVGDNVKVLASKKGVSDTVIVDRKGVIEKFGVPPESLPDYFGLMGDKSDNIPGVMGFGEKTALEYVKGFETIENLYKNIEKVENEKKREMLRQNEKNAFLSKKLFTIDSNVPVEFDIKKCARGNENREEIAKILKEMEFTSVLKEMTEEENAEVEYKVIVEIEKLKGLVQIIEKMEEISVDTETTHEEPMFAELVGISIALEPYKAYYIPVGHTSIGSDNQLKREEVLELLKPMLENEKIKKIGHNIKYDYIVFKNYGIEIKNISFDTMVGSYVLNPGQTRHNLDDVALNLLNVKKIAFNSLVDKKNVKNFAETLIEKASQYSCEDADVTLRLKVHEEKEIEKMNLNSLFREIEMPLVRVLAEMEITGVKIDVECLKAISEDMGRKIKTLTDDIYKQCGDEFNINSPKQLGGVLFEKLKLPVARKTKTGYSTDEETLTGLKKNHPVIEKIIEYRQNTKLKNTYVDALPELINPKTGRIHTSFNQAVTATGRLSSSGPNLQNIPIRTELGKSIRKAFIPSDDKHKILSVDYSQIELRILAHITKDPGLIEAFRNGEDIHARTASEIYGIDINHVDESMRRTAKMVNFGVAYGMTGFGLSERLEIPREEAATIIEQYFVKYAKIKDYYNYVKDFAHTHGYVETLMGRRRYIPELKNENRQVREFGERTAINTPIQGTAADIIKKAMICIHDCLEKEKLATKMILQVHDELVFDVPVREMDEVKKMVKNDMEDVVKLEVPVKVDMFAGKNWYEEE